MESIPVWLGAVILLIGAAALSGGLLALLGCDPAPSRDHLRTCTASRGCRNACRAKRTCSTPSTTCIAMRDDTTSTDRSPSSALADICVCDDSCKQVPCTKARGSTASNCSGFFSSMAVSVPAQGLAGHIHNQQGDTLL